MADNPFDAKCFMTMGCCNCCCFLIAWIVYCTTFMGLVGDMRHIILPKLDSFDYDNQSPLISSFYKADRAQECLDQNDTILQMTWPGTVTICYGENVGFLTKREYRDKKYPMKYLRGPCYKNGYGDREDCDGTEEAGESCSKIKDLRRYEDVYKLKPESMQIFDEKVYCGKTLVGQ